MQLTRGSEYAIRAILDLASKPDETKIQLKEIAARMDIPEDFLAKIFQILNRTGIVKSFRGTKGGYTLAKPPEQITLKDIISAVDGPIQLNKCLDVACIDKTQCNYTAKCPVHDVWQEAQSSLLSILHKANFKVLVENLALKNAANNN
ncbi:MAG TPA: Rrf2 family transcriptional regulator [Candidatus Wallbacteria bacterium]|nr:Rrf2 family transcriptional regulator [Candidatus Wallbacteria bacterium]